MGAYISQNDFTHGELDPRLVARSDLAVYRKGAQKLRNIVVEPQGGAKRRFGTKFIASITANSDEYQIAAYEFSETKRFLLVFTNLKLDIYLDDVKVADVETPYTGAMLTANTVKYTRGPTSFIIVHPDFQTKELVRNDDTTWHLTPVDFKNLPTEDFNDTNYDDMTFSLSALNVGDLATLTITGTGYAFTEDLVGGIFETFGDDTTGLDSSLGQGRITEYVTATTVKIDIKSKFNSALTGGVPGTDVFLGEPAWSANRGYPSSADFYEGRLIFGGSKSLPSRIFMSVVNDPRDFDEAQGDDADAINIDILTSGITNIKYVIGDKSLQVFTTSGEFSIPQFNEKPITPKTIALRQQSSYGAENVKPVLIDNSTLYIKRGGKGVMVYSYDSDAQAYTSTEVSILSPHLIVNPVSMSILKGSSTEDANYLFSVNADGTMAVYQTLIDEKVSAWTLSETSNTTDTSRTPRVGKFKRVVGVLDEVYFIVERVVNSNTVQYIEKLDFDLYTDSSYTNTYGVPTDVITGLDHLENEWVRVRGDGYVLLEKQVIGGEITLEREVLEVEAGLNYDPLIKPMPISIDSQNGTTTYLNKRIIRAYIDYYQSIGIYVNNILIPYNEFGEEAFQVPTVKTDVAEIPLMSDWGPREIIEITQQEPLPMHILGIGYEVEVG